MRRLAVSSFGMLRLGYERLMRGFGSAKTGGAGVRHRRIVRAGTAGLCVWPVRERKVV